MSNTVQVEQLDRELLKRCPKCEGHSLSPYIPNYLRALFTAECAEQDRLARQWWNSHRAERRYDCDWSALGPLCQDNMTRELFTNGTLAPLVNGECPTCEGEGLVPDMDKLCEGCLKRKAEMWQGDDHVCPECFDDRDDVQDGD